MHCLTYLRNLMIPCPELSTSQSWETFWDTSIGKDLIVDLILINNWSLIPFVQTENHKTVDSRKIPKWSPPQNFPTYSLSTSQPSGNISGRRSTPGRAQLSAKSEVRSLKRESESSKTCQKDKSVSWDRFLLVKMFNESFPYDFGISNCL